LKAEKERFHRFGEIGPYTRLLDEWNTEFFPLTREDNQEMRQESNDGEDADDVLEAIAQAEAYGNGEE
jgi:hypothetical protein